MADWFNNFLTWLRDNSGISVSILVSSVVVGLRALREKTSLTAALIDIVIAGFAAPTVVWILWRDAPFFVYGLISAVVARWPELVRAFFSAMSKK